MNHRNRPTSWAIEALVGLALAAILVIVAWTSSGEVPFVYRGL